MTNPFSSVPVIKGAYRILDFDIENRPLSYWYQDRPTADVTAIASCWVGQLRSMSVSLLGEVSTEEMLRRFAARYNEADLVTGHYIRKHDLPILNGAMIEAGLPPLEPKMTQDTKLDLQGLGDLPATQEHLAEMLGIKSAKFNMTQAKWRSANRLTPEGLLLIRKRVQGDVVQHMALRRRLLELGLLSGPVIWQP